MSWWLKPASFTFVPIVGGFCGSMFTRQEIPHWYRTLVKPSFTPPNWVFGPVWTSLYAAMGYASYLVYRDGGGLEGPARAALTLYGAQLALNMAWTPIFFKYHRLGLACVEILLYDASLVAVMFAYYPINRVAFYLNIPHAMWLCLATALTLSIYRLNPEAETDKEKLR